MDKAVSFFSKGISDFAHTTTEYWINSHLTEEFAAFLSQLAVCDVTKTGSFLHVFSWVQLSFCWQNFQKISSPDKEPLGHCSVLNVTLSVNILKDISILTSLFCCASLFEIRTKPQCCCDLSLFIHRFLSSCGTHFLLSPVLFYF